MTARLLPRLLVVAVALACAVAAATARQHDTRCAAVVERARQPPAGDPVAAGVTLGRQALRRCDDALRVVEVALLLTGSDRRLQALTVARGLVARAPEDYRGWFLLSRLEEDPALSRLALVAARTLNPTVASGTAGGPGAPP